MSHCVICDKLLSNHEDTFCTECDEISGETLAEMQIEDEDELNFNDAFEFD